MRKQNFLLNLLVVLHLARSRLVISGGTHSNQELGNQKWKTKDRTTQQLEKVVISGGNLSNQELANQNCSGGQRIAPHSNIRKLNSPICYFRRKPFESRIVLEDKGSPTQQYKKAELSYLLFPERKPFESGIVVEDKGSHLRAI